MATKHLSQKILDNIKHMFVLETKEKILQINKLLTNIQDKETMNSGDNNYQNELEQLFYLFHTLKGTGLSVGFPKVTALAQEALQALSLCYSNICLLGQLHNKLQEIINLIEDDILLVDNVKQTINEDIELNISKEYQGKVLVIDDDKVLLSIIKQRLELDGLDTYVFSTADEAFNWLEHNSDIDLVIIDVVMPDNNGFDICKKIRKRVNYETLSILFLTAESSLDDKLTGFNLGADDFLPKPFELEELAARVNSIIMRKKVYEKNTLQDPLTGIYNRKYLSLKFKEEILRNSRNNGVFSICLLDLDYFKQINDKYGHQVGDETLRNLVKIIGENIRSTDILARYGGEEFVLMLIDTSAENALMVVDRIRQRFACNELRNCHEAKPFCITFSAGIAEFNKDGTSEQELLHKADQALYQAKNSGRNKVLIYQNCSC